jgi:chromosome segregation ATPase
MLAEPEPEPEADDVPSAAEMAMQALNRQRAKTAEQEAALRQAQDEAAELKLQLEDLRAELAQRPEAGASSGDESGLQAKVSDLAAELENARADAAAAGVALERLERESTDQEAALAAAEERAERLEAEVARLGEAASRTIGLGGDAGGEVALLTALDQTRAATAQIESIVAENRRLADELAAMLRSQEALVAALTGLQTEVTEQRAWFEAQLASARESEVQQAGVVDALQSGLKEKEAELEALREQLLDVEAKRAEEAAAFVAALERQ